MKHNPFDDHFFAKVRLKKLWKIHLPLYSTKKWKCEAKEADAKTKDDVFVKVKDIDSKFCNKYKKGQEKERLLLGAKERNLFEL